MAYTPKSTIKGLKSFEWNSDYTASRDEKEKWTGSESFTCKLNDVTKLVPSTGTACQLQGWSFMKVSGVKITNIEGDLAQVTCEYGGFQDGDDPDDTSKVKYTYELGIVTNEEPIESHPNYKDVDDEELVIIQNVKSGKYQLVAGEEYKYTNISDAGDDEEYEITSTEGRELIDFISKGVESYLAPSQIWRATFTSKKLPSASILNSVGKVTSAEGAPTISSGRNWLFLGCNVSEENKIYTISYEWMLSGAGGWSDELYDY
jgi:hypothetical protein